MRTICAYCKFGTWDSEKGILGCRKDMKPTRCKLECDGHVCAERDMVDGTRSKRSKCFICGKPIYSRGRDVPVYCEEHRAYSERDSQLLERAPRELLFSLVSAIFLRAREDYIFNTDGKRNDAEVFLRSAWAQELSLQGFDVETLMEQLNEEIRNESERN